MYHYYKCFDANLPHLRQIKTAATPNKHYFQAKHKTVSHISQLTEKIHRDSLHFENAWLLHSARSLRLFRSPALVAPHSVLPIFGMLTMMLYVRAICSSSKSRLPLFFLNEWHFFSMFHCSCKHSHLWWFFKADHLLVSSVFFLVCVCWSYQSKLLCLWIALWEGKIKIANEWNTC